MSTIELYPKATADDIQINNAILKATPGDTVYLNDGTYSISKPIVMKSGIKLIGDGKKNTDFLVPKSALSTFNVGDGSIIRLPACTNVELGGFKIDGNDGLHEHCGFGWENGIMMYSGGSNVKIHDIDFTRINGDAIRTYSHPGPCYIDNIRVSTCGHDAIRCQKVDNWHISNLYCDIYINYAVRFTDATNCSLKYSTFTALVGSGNAAVGIEGTGAPGLVIDHCRFESIGSYVNKHGIYVESGAGNVTVKNNIFWKCFDGGIFSENAGNVKFIIENNIFDSCAYATSNPAGATLRGNIISNCTSYVVKGRSPSTTSLIGNNIFGGKTSGTGAMAKGTLTGNPGYRDYINQVFIPLLPGAPLYNAMASWKSAGYGAKEPETPAKTQYDIRLKEATPDTVLSESPYIDVGGSSEGRYRDLIWFDLSKYTSKVGKALLSMFWYYPHGATRTGDTIIEVYRPASWNPDYVSWNKKNNNVSWTNKGGDWYDKNGTAQGSSPYASLTFSGSKVPDNKYYDLDVTGLVNEYLTKKWDNTGFFIKAKTESNDYIAFYSFEGTNKPVLKIDTTIIEPVGCVSCKNTLWSLTIEGGKLKIKCSGCGKEYQA